jgi:hypothetical protein
MASGNGRLIELLIGAAKVILGGAFVYEGGKMLSGTNGQGALLGRDDLGRAAIEGGRTSPSWNKSLSPPSQPPEGRVIKSSKMHKVRNIEERVGYIKKLIQRDSTSPRVKEAVARILGRKCGDKWCVPPKNYSGEVAALFNAVHDPKSPYALRYTRDHVTVDQFSSVSDLMDMKIGDCDDGAIYLAALLTSAGYPVKLRVIQAKGAPSWSHIYVLAGAPPNGPTKWVPLDWSVDRPAGWEVGGASQSAQLGQPAGMVERVKDFPLYG